MQESFDILGKNMLRKNYGKNVKMQIWDNKWNTAYGRMEINNKYNHKWMLKIKNIDVYARVVIGIDDNIRERNKCFAHKKDTNNYSLYAFYGQKISRKEFAKYLLHSYSLKNGDIVIMYLEKESNKSQNNMYNLSFEIIGKSWHKKKLAYKVPFEDHQIFHLAVGLTYENEEIQFLDYQRSKLIHIEDDDDEKVREFDENMLNWEMEVMRRKMVFLKSEVNDKSNEIQNLRNAHLKNTKEVSSLQKKIRRMSCVDLFDVDDQKSNDEDDDLDFTLIKQLGTGSFGSVFSAKDVINNRLVAIKIVNIDPKSEKEVLAVENEVDLMRKANNCKSIVDWYGYVLKPNNMDSNKVEHWIVMELCHGSVMDLIKNNPHGMSDSQLKKGTIDIVRALDFIHNALNIIHRDVKPDNILISSSGTLKLSDFGIAKEVFGTIAKTEIGTCFYMPPEQINTNLTATGEYDFKVDIWAVGMSLYQMANGKLPKKYITKTKQGFSALKNYIIGFGNGNGDDFIPPRLSSTDYKKDLCDFVEFCLQIDTDKRASAEELLLHRYLA